MTDAPERIDVLIRHGQVQLATGNGWKQSDFTPYVRADLIEAQAAEIARLREALKPFAFLDQPTTQDAWEIIYLDRVKDWIDFEDIDTARAALTATPDPLT
jgi:hypothetical protein